MTEKQLSEKILNGKIYYNNMREISEIVAKNAVFDELSGELKEEIELQSKFNMTQFLNEL